MLVRVASQYRSHRCTVQDRAVRSAPAAANHSFRARRAAALGAVRAHCGRVVAGSAALAVVGVVRVGWPALRGHRALRRLLRSARRPPAASLRAVADVLGIAGRVEVVGTGEAFAVTHGLLRPRILLSTGLVAALDEAELTAVLVHERHHLQRRDPLRLLACRLLAGYGWFLPLLRWYIRRVSVRWELAADRAATTSAGVAAVAGALLKLADLPVPAAVAAANPMGDAGDRAAGHRWCQRRATGPDQRCRRRFGLVRDSARQAGSARR